MLPSQLRSVLVLLFAFSVSVQNALASTFPDPAYSLPGIPPSGAPGFTNSAQISLFQLGSDSFLFAATNADAPLTFDLGKHDISVTTNAATFLVTAQFNKAGSYVQNSGTVTISGSMPFVSLHYPYILPGVSLVGDLLTAKLDVFAFDDNLLGFSTKFLSGVGTLFGTYESVYFSAAGIANSLGFGTANGLHATASPIQAYAVTSVPVPGAVWLFASGLALVGLRKKAV